MHEQTLAYEGNVGRNVQQVLVIEGGVGRNAQPQV